MTTGCWLVDSQSETAARSAVNNFLRCTDVTGMYISTCFVSFQGKPTFAQVKCIFFSLPRARFESRFLTLIKIRVGNRFQCSQQQIVLDALSTIRLMISWFQWPFSTTGRGNAITIGLCVSAAWADYCAYSGSTTTLYKPRSTSAAVVHGHRDPTSVRSGGDRRVLANRRKIPLATSLLHSVDSYTLQYVLQRAMLTRLVCTRRTATDSETGNRLTSGRNPANVREQFGDQD